MIIDETLIPKSFSSSVLADNSSLPFSCLSNPTRNTFGIAFKFSKILIDSLAAVPADKTSSIINTLPAGVAPIMVPPSPW